MGGMACAAALAKFGHKVLVLEQHYVAGGFTHTFSRKGFTWDVGVHCVGEMSKNHLPGRLVRWLSDDQVNMVSMGDIYEKFYFPNEFEIDFPGTRTGFKEALYAKFPDERESIDRYFNAIREAVRSSKPYFAFKTFPRWVDCIASGILKAIGRKNYWTMTTESVLAELVPNPRLRAVLCAQWGYYGATPKSSSFGVHAIVVRHFMDGGYYPAGGAGVIAESFLNTVKNAGGAAVVRASVKEIIIERGRAVGVLMDDGRKLLAPKIVSAAGAMTTVTSLLPENHKNDRWASDIRELAQSPPHVCLYFGLEGDVRAAGATLANQWFFETWDMEHAFWDVENPDSVAPVIYVSFPSLKDPFHDSGPLNRHTMEAVTFVPWKAFEKWKNSRRGYRDQEYIHFKKSIEERMIAQMSKHAPELMKLVKHCELSTPLSTVHFTRAPQGAIYGLAPTPARFSNQSLRTRTPVGGLYLAGADVATLGVTGALMGGILAASTIDRRVMNKLK